MTRDEKLKRADQTLRQMVLEAELAPSPPSPTADVYKIANYADGLVGANGCDALLPRWDSGLKWADKNNLKPDDFLMGGGVYGGVKWDGVFYRDTARYAAGGNLFWSPYLKAGSAAGIKNGFWLNFGSAWAHLANDDPAQMLSGAAPRIYFDGATSEWKLVVEATQYVTFAVVEVWRGVKAGGTTPAGVYTRVSGLDPLASLEIVAG